MLFTALWVFLKGGDTFTRESRCIFMWLRARKSGRHPPGVRKTIFDLLEQGTSRVVVHDRGGKCAVALS